MDFMLFGWMFSLPPQPMQLSDLNAKRKSA